MSYNESLRVFLWLRFDRDDDLNGPDFDRAVWAYRLLKWVDLGNDHLVRSGTPEYPRLHFRSW